MCNVYKVSGGGRKICGNFADVCGWFLGRGGIFLTVWSSTFTKSKFIFSFICKVL